MRFHHMAVFVSDLAENRAALEQMERFLKADVRPSTELDLGHLAAGR